MSICYYNKNKTYKGNALRQLLVGIILLLAISSLASAQEKALNFAIFPYTSPSKILTHNKALKHFLQKELNRPVSIITAKNVKEYWDNVQTGTYDILFAAPHLGRQSELKFSYQRITMIKNNIKGYYIVRKTS